MREKKNKTIILLLNQMIQKEYDFTDEFIFIIIDFIIIIFPEIILKQSTTTKSDIINK